MSSDMIMFLCSIYVVAMFILLQNAVYNLGACLGILLTYKRSGYRGALDITTDFFSMKVHSPYYEYLSKNRGERKIQQIIRFNSRVGMTTSMISITAFTFIEFLPVIIFGEIVPSYYLLIFICTGLCVSICLFRYVCHDRKYFKNPLSFRYRFHLDQ